MPYIKSFLPWIIFAAMPNWKQGAVAALVVSIVVIAHHRRVGQAWGDQMIELVSGGYFAVIAIIASAAPHSGFQHYAGPVGTGVLGVMAWVSLAANDPFTLPIARRQAPEAVWHTKGFLHANNVITAAWAVAFTASAAIAIILQLHHASTALSVVVRVAGFVVPMLFTRAYTSSRSHAAAPQQPASN